MIPVEDMQMDLWKVRMIQKLAAYHNCTPSEELDRILTEYIGSHADFLHALIEGELK